jgi:hypothetical protein
MEYVIEMPFSGPVATAVAHVLASLPPDVASRTSVMPGMARGFVVLAG